MQEVVFERSYYRPGIFVARLINALIGIIEAVLAVRLILELLGASASSQFVAAVYGITDRFLGPFVGAFPNVALGGGYMLDVAAVLAMIGYAILGWLVIKIFSFVFSSL